MDHLILTKVCSSRKAFSFGRFKVANATDQPEYLQVRPVNRAPYFVDELPARISVEQGAAYNFTLPLVFDLDGDSTNITL